MWLFIELKTTLLSLEIHLLFQVESVQQLLTLFKDRCNVVTMKKKKETKQHQIVETIICISIFYVIKYRPLFIYYFCLIRFNSPEIALMISSMSQREKKIIRHMNVTRSPRYSFDFRSNQRISDRYELTRIRNVICIFRYIRHQKKHKSTLFQCVIFLFKFIF